MAHFRFHHEKLHCPYDMCGKDFERPLMITDSSSIIRETYYACPHCQSKLAIHVDDPSHPQMVAVGDTLDLGAASPTHCPHHLGYLKHLPEDAGIPDECAVCPRIIQCFVKRT